MAASSSSAFAAPAIVLSRAVRSAFFPLLQTPAFLTAFYTVPHTTTTTLSRSTLSSMRNTLFHPGRILDHWGWWLRPALAWEHFYDGRHGNLVTCADVDDACEQDGAPEEGSFVFLRPRAKCKRKDIKMRSASSPWPRDPKHKKIVPQVRGLVEKLLK
ncbi:unnamed protein product [Amoebophrya sp. A120]|nr:unnamed protein product [Amoebophrya sp. A120]|eukprot:GSA120T00001052001.1